MESSTEQIRWLVKVLQPENTVASLPGGASLSEDARAALLGIPPDVYAAELARLQDGAKEAARELLATPGVGEMVDRLPLRKGARIVAFGDSHTSDRNRGRSFSVRCWRRAAQPMTSPSSSARSAARRPRRG